RPVRPFALGERRAAAGKAELVANAPLVERVYAHAALGPRERHFVGRGEVVDVAFAPADRAVAGDAPGRQRFVDRRADGAAVATGHIAHCAPSWPLCIRAISAL